MSISGLVSQIGSNLSGKATSFVKSLDPTTQKSGVVKNIPQFPPIFDTSNSSIFNPHYQIYLSGKDELNEDIAICAALPEHFSFHVSADWQPLLNNPSLTSILSNLIKDATVAGEISKKAFGVADYSAAATAQVWNSTSPLEFNIPFVFNAVNSATDEVMAPIKALMKLVSPSLTAQGNFLLIPGPSVIDGIQNKGYKMQLRIGKSLIFENVIVTGVAPMFDTMVDSRGDFISAQCDVTIRTTKIITKEDIDNIFSNLISTSSTGQNDPVIVPDKPVTPQTTN